MGHHTPRNMLVTGGAGFIGCNFVRRVLRLAPEVRVVNLDALTYAGSLDSLANVGGPRYQFVQGDICDRALVYRLLAEHQIDTVVHFAAESHVDRSIDGPGIFIRTNMLGTQVLLDACREYWGKQTAHCRFHHISTDEVFGSLRPGDPPFSENSLYQPNSPYSASKAGSDHVVRSYFHTYGLPVVTTHCSNNFGPYQHFEKFIPTVIGACLRQQPIPVYGDGSNIRDWLHVDDHCAGIEAVLHRGRVGECYNIGGDNEHSNMDIARLICSFMDELRPAGAPHQRLISLVKDRQGHDWRYAINAEKIRSELGWAVRGNFRDALRATVQWYILRMA